ncbi:hypothetical protein [Gillisia sp. JM1]|uniref:hypothetical protein n=1 Tax=Gillisia sp. JM1 TaxID=1283286 RepID=UPI000414DFD0|nr:hypothetical protein [Gillisia sp. JM1]
MNLGSQKLLEKLDFKYLEEISLPNSKEPLLLYKWKANWYEEAIIQMYACITNGQFG